MYFTVQCNQIILNERHLSGKNGLRPSKNRFDWTTRPAPAGKLFQALNTVLLKAKGIMHPSTTAVITATEYTDGIFLLIHMFRFFMDLCVHLEYKFCHEYYYFASLGTFMHQEYRMQRLTKSLHIFLYGQEIIRRFWFKM